MQLSNIYFSTHNTAFALMNRADYEGVANIRTNLRRRKGIKDTNSETPSISHNTVYITFVRLGL